MQKAAQESFRQETSFINSLPQKGAFQVRVGMFPLQIMVISIG